LQARSAAKEKQERERASCVQTFKTLGGLLLEDESPKKTAVVNGVQLDKAFVQYYQMLGSGPTALQREWKTQQSVLGALNELHGQDEDKVFSSIRTRKGFDFYVETVKGLTAGKKHKVFARMVSTAWNTRVQQMLTSAQSDAARQRINLEYGFLSEKEAQTHSERLEIRMEQTQQVASIADSMIALCSRVKHRSKEVDELEAPVSMPSSMQPGVGGPGARVMLPSALNPAPKRANDANDDRQLNLEQMANTCFLCYDVLGRSHADSLQGRANAWLNEHSGNRKGSTVQCAHFDEKYPPCLCGSDDCLTTHMKERVALTTKAKKAKKAMREKNSRLKKARAQKNETS
jgi:hypothetical protein